MRLVLASTSPARLATLRAAGIEPLTIAPGVDEERAVADAESESGVVLAAPDLVQLLARLKAEAVVGRAIALLGGTSGVGTGGVGASGVGAAGGAAGSGLVFGGDSAFEFGGRIYGKPHLPEVALERWRAQRGGTGVLHSGHWVIAIRDGAVVDAVGEASRASVTFSADLSDSELDAYVATGEPLSVAGAFTIDSLGAAFIDRIEGDPSTVVGLSVPLLRRLAGRVGVAWPSLWNAGSVPTADTAL